MARSAYRATRACAVLRSKRRTPLAILLCVTTQDSFFVLLFEEMVRCDLCVERSSQGPPCSTCGLHVCRQCARKCVVEYPSFPALATCVGCGREWDTAELNARIGKTFWSKEFRTARRTYLLEREQPLLDGTRPAALHEQRLRDLRLRIREARALVCAEPHYAPHRVVHRSLLRDLSIAQQRGVTHVQYAPLRCCTCNAYAVRNENGVCDHCGARTCLQCGTGHADDAVCDPDTVATLRTIRAECRSCVHCNAPSQRAEGCAVMWCAWCGTFWNWDTRRVIPTRHHMPHNPDHQRWQATHQGALPREVDDIPCGGLPDASVVHAALLREVLIHMEVHPMASLILEATELLHDAQRLRHRLPHDVRATDNSRAIRVAMLLGDVDDSKASLLLERDERLRHMRRDVRHVFDTLVLSGTDVLQRFCESRDGIRTTLLRLMELRQICDDALADLARVHERKVPRIGLHWRLVTSRSGQ